MCNKAIGQTLLELLIAVVEEIQYLDVRLVSSGTAQVPSLWNPLQDIKRFFPLFRAMVNNQRQPHVVGRRR